MAQPQSGTGQTKENGHPVRRDDRERYSTDSVGYATGAEGDDDEPGWRSRSLIAETSRLSLPVEREPPSGPGVSPEPGPSSPPFGARPTQGVPTTSPTSSRWYREPVTVAEVMTREVKTVTPLTPIAQVAALMRDEDVGAVPVVDASGLLDGIVTDRDIVVRGLADRTDGPPSAGRLCAADVSTKDVDTVSPNDSISDVLNMMGRKRIRRAPVVAQNRRLIGMISLGDIASRADYDRELQDALQHISARRSFWSRLWR